MGVTITLYGIWLHIWRIINQMILRVAGNRSAFSHHFFSTQQMDHLQTSKYISIHGQSLILRVCGLISLTITPHTPQSVSLLWYFFLLLLDQLIPALLVLEIYKNTLVFAGIRKKWRQFWLTFIPDSFGFHIVLKCYVQ